MPKFLFYTGTAFCLFLALTSAAESLREVQGASVAFAAVQTGGVFSARAPWAIVVAFIAGLAAAVIFVRMASLLAARNLFGAFLAVVCVTGAIASLTGVLLLQARMLAVAKNTAVSHFISELHLAGFLVLGYFVSLSLLAMRPYFRIQASRSLAALVLLPLPIFALMIAQELFVHASSAPLPARTPASLAFFAVLSILFFAIAMHCIRHRHLFLEMTNLRELLEGRFDPTLRGTHRPIGGVAFDS